MAERRALSKKVRFEVFKRDKFTCQYCGAKAPDVVLQVDHIDPVAKGGTNDILNLLTSCQPCNGGKGARPISDGSALDRQRDQLEALEERRQQIEMMLAWKQELAAQDETLVDACAQTWSRVALGWSLNTTGRGHVRKMLRDRGFAAVHEAMVEIGDRYPSAAATKQDAATIEKMFIQLRALVKHGNDEQGRELAYVIGILKNRCNDRQIVFHADLRRAVEQGLSVDWLRETAKSVDSWFEFEDLCTGAIVRRQRAP